MPPRKRRSRNKSPADIVAPGGGTQADVDKLAKNLGMGSDDVAAILNSEGSGVPRRSRSSGTTEAAAPIASSAWADFMTDEGFANDSKESSKTEEEKPSKRAKTIVNESDPREYVLPITIKNVKPGILAQTGSLDSKMIGRTKRTLKEDFDLQDPTILGYESIFEKKKIKVIATSSSACHSIVIDTDGTAYAWGRNENGQCGFGYTSTCVPVPKKIEHASKFVAAAVGKSHSILVTDDGICYAVGWNKYGQCGVNTSTEAINNWKKCVFAQASGVKIVQVSSIHPTHCHYLCKCVLNILACIRLHVERTFLFY